MDFTKIKKLFIGGMELKQLFIGNKFDNKVPKSIDMDGSIYQAGKGYIDEYRLSSSGGLSGQANTVTTGFIEYQAGDLIRMSGVDWKPAITSETRYCYLAFYNSQFNVLGSINCFNTTDVSSGYNGIARGICTFKNGINMPSIANGVTTFDNINFSDTTQIAYFRVNGYGSGADMIVTVDEEIEMHQIWKSGYKNWVQYSIDKDGSIYGGVGYKNGYRIGSDGGERSGAGKGVATGYIEVKPGNVIRIASKGDIINPYISNSTNCVCYCNSSFTKLGYFLHTGTFNGICTAENSVITEEVYRKKYRITVPNDPEIQYVRLSVYCPNDPIGEDLIVTINEEIA